MDFILPQTDIQYKATPLGTLNIRFLGNAVPMRLLEDSHKELQLDKWEVKMNIKAQLMNTDSLNRST